MITNVRRRPAGVRRAGGDPHLRHLHPGPGPRRGGDRAGAGGHRRTSTARTSRVAVLRWRARPARRSGRDPRRPAQPVRRGGRIGDAVPGDPVDRPRRRPAAGARRRADGAARCRARRHRRAGLHRLHHAARRQHDGDGQPPGGDLDRARRSPRTPGRHAIPGRRACSPRPAVIIRSPDPSKPVETSRALAQEIADVSVIVAARAVPVPRDHPLRHLDRPERGRGEEQPDDGGHPLGCVAIRASGRQGAGRQRSGAAPARSRPGHLGHRHRSPRARSRRSCWETRRPFACRRAWSRRCSSRLRCSSCSASSSTPCCSRRPGSLVSRQEEVSQVITPMTLLVSGAYLIALYSSLGAIESDASWVVALSWVPFMSPYLMLSRLNAGAVGPLEVAIAASLMALTIVVVAWIASRIYAAGVLRYGQRASLGGLWSAVRGAR